MAFAESEIFPYLPAGILCPDLLICFSGDEAKQGAVIDSAGQAAWPFFRTADIGIGEVRKWISKS